MTVYKSKIGWEVIAIVAASFAIPGYFLVQDMQLNGVAILVATALILAFFFSRIRYEVSTSKLKIYGDIMNRKPIDISSIQSIRETNNLTAAAAVSLDRLEITHGEFSSRVLISPKDKAGFIRHILSINPNVSVLYKTKNKRSDSNK